MTMRSFIQSKVFLFGFLILVFSGCASTKPARFYTLNVNESAGTIMPSASYKYRVAIGPVEIPDYLDRPQIVSRTSRNELTLAEFDRWAGSLKDDITNVLSEDLSRLLYQNAVSVTPWEWGDSSDYRVAVDIRRLDIMPEGYVLMNARWNLIGKDGITILFTSESSAKEPIREQTYSAKVSSMSSALAKLSQDMAETLKKFVHKK